MTSYDDDAIFARMTHEERKRYLEVLELTAKYILERMTPQQKQIVNAKLMGVKVHDSPSIN
jgi:hypothetical protein